jgi:uroporphyrinogen decarboxylase
MDLGAFSFTSIVIGIYKELNKRLGIEDTPVLGNRQTQAVIVGPKTIEKLDIDFRTVYRSPSMKNKDVESSRYSYIDMWGVERFKPDSSIYYDQTGYALSGPITKDDIKNHTWPDPRDPDMYEGMRERAKKLREQSDTYAVAYNPGTIFTHISQYLRGYEDWFVDVLTDHELICYLFDTILDISCEMVSRALDEVGPFIDVIGISDDLAMQNSMFVSPETYRELIKPRHKRFFDLIRSKTSAKIVFHTCGAVEPLIGDFIDIGVDALNPVQVAAKGMDPLTLKQKYGRHITFWGGIDTQHLLPNATPERVYEETRRIIEIFGRDGGYVLNAVHAIQPDVPVDNILAMYRAGRSK